MRTLDPIAERRIREAIERRELEDLAGEGAGATVCPPARAGSACDEKAWLRAHTGQACKRHGQFLLVVTLIT